MNNASDFIIENGILKEYTGPGGDIVIPEGVTEIGYWCFPENNITSVMVPESLKSIRNRAFSEGGESLADGEGFCRAGSFLINYIGDAREITVPEGIKTVLKISGKELNTIRLPSTIESIGDCEECKRLEEVIFPDDCPGFREIGYRAFAGCARLTRINIPDCVRIVGSNAFDGCRFLYGDPNCQIIGPVLYRYNRTDPHPVIPEGVRLISDDAFRKCGGMTDITLPDSLTCIGASAFYNLKSLRHVSIPEGVTSIGASAFYGCDLLTDITLPNRLSCISRETFSGCKGLKNVVLPEKLTVIEEKAFQFCDALAGIVFPDGLKEIGKEAFYSCGSLTDIILPEGMTVIGERTFASCSNLKSVEIPASVTYIGEGAFRNCTVLENVRIPESVTGVSETAFSECSMLKDKDGFVIIAGGLHAYYGTGGFVSIPEGVKAIGRGSLSYKCLTGVTFPESLKSIGASAFSRNPELTEIELPPCLETIGEGAFSSCRYLKHVRIPSSVQSISDSAFAECSEQFTAVFEKDPGKMALGKKLFPQKAVISFDGFTPGSDQDFIVQSGVLTKYRGYLNDLSIPEGVAEIGESALSPWFQKVRKVTLPDTVRNIHRNAFIVPLLGDQQTRVPPMRVQRMNGMPDQMSIPKGYFEQEKGSYDTEMAILLLEGPWKQEATEDDYVSIVLRQSAKPLLDFCFEHFSKNPAGSVDRIAAAVAGISNVTTEVRQACERAAHLALENIRVLSPHQLGALYEAAKNAKATPALRLLNQYAPAENLKAKSSSSAPKAKAAGSEQQMSPLEEKLREEFSLYDLDMTLKTAVPIESYNKYCIFDNFDFSGVRYAGSDEEVSPYILKYVIAMYVGQLESRPKRGYMVCDRFEFDPEADRIAETFDGKAFQKLVEKIELCHETVAVKCRYGSEKEIIHIGAMINKGLRDRRDTFHIVALEAILLSDTRRAMIIADENNLLGRYARMRHTKAEILRDTKILDFGFDPECARLFDTGGTTIKATLNRDMTMTLYDLQSQKEVRSLPKKGADPEKLQQATEELSDLKKNIRKIISNRRKELFPLFLSGGTVDLARWKRSYLGNPVFHRLAETIVWNQNGKSFILTEKGAVESDGAAYEIKNSGPIGIAHPLEMEQQDVLAWQKYITAQGIKQPFVQIWEPVPALYEIKPDRYKGCMIEYCRFLGREQHGIWVYDSDYHNDISIEFTDCHAEVKRIDWARHEISMDHRFEITSIKLKSIASRMSNHVIAYLDRITIYDRIRKDDLSVADNLHGSNIAQIMDYIRCAQEANAVNTLAALLDYREKLFPDFDPLADYTLEWET